jgi:hypothetical protein
MTGSVSGRLAVQSPTLSSRARTFVMTEYPKFYPEMNKTGRWFVAVKTGTGPDSHVGDFANGPGQFFKMSRSMRSRSFSRCKRAISAAWSADGSVACVVWRRAAPRYSTQRRKTESRRASSLATDPTERPLAATRSTA